MTKLFSELLATGMVTNLGGDDERLAKMEQAAADLAKQFREHPRELIDAVLAGLALDVHEDDPTIQATESALLAHWKTMRSVHTDRPVQLLRAIQLEACAQAADAGHAAIVWLTAVDTLPLVRLGREAACVRDWIAGLASRVEKKALMVPGLPTEAPPAIPRIEPVPVGQAPQPYKVDRGQLRKRVGATAGPNNQKSQAYPEPNPYWPQTGGSNWSWEFTERMHVLLADELEAVAAEVRAKQADLHAKLGDAQTKFATALNGALTQHQQWTRDAIAASEVRQKADQLRLNALWWSEALYSPSLHRSYRELPAALAAVVMALDLLAEVSIPSPASVGFLLAETVRRLDGETQPFEKFLIALREARADLPRDVLRVLEGPPEVGRFSVRDLIALALGDQEWNPAGAIKRAGLPPDLSLDLPRIAHAVFRQEQALRLARGTK